MTLDVWVAYHPDQGPLLGTISKSKETAWMTLYASKMAGAPIELMRRYSEDHKAAQDWVRQLGYEIIPAKLKYEEVKR